MRVDARRRVRRRTPNICSKEPPSKHLGRQVALLAIGRPSEQHAERIGHNMDERVQMLFMEHRLCPRQRRNVHVWSRIVHV